MPEIVELGYMDLNPFVMALAISHGVVFSGALEVGKFEKAWATLGKAWPILGAHVRSNETSKKLELVIPDVADTNLKATFEILDSTLAETENLYIPTKTISTQTCIRTERLYRSRPPQNLMQHAVSGESIFALHIAYLNDATFITMTFPHIVDGGGYSILIKSLLLALAEQPIPPLLSHDPWAVMMPEALRTPVDSEAVKSWMSWDNDSIAALMQQAEADHNKNVPAQTRTVYFPAAEIAQMKRDATADLEKIGYEALPFSTTDVIGAWFYKYAPEYGPDSESKSRYSYLFNVREQFPEAFLPEQPYIRNAFFIVCADQLTDSQLRAMSLGEIARIIRMSVIGHSTRVSVLSKLKCNHEHAGEFYVPFSPGDRLRGVSSWLSFRLEELSAARHIKPGTGTGEVVDISGDAIGRQNLALIKYRDADGGVVCEMDWGTKSWTSGPISKFAIEQQS